MSESLWTVREVAAELSIHEKRVYELPRRGCPALKVPGVGLRFDPAAVRAWVASHAVGGEPVPVTSLRRIA